jgi:quercetin dioxygenase-like cupin family protein
MPSPESPQYGVVFDLGAIDREMRQDEAYEREGHTARTLVHALDLRVLLVIMRAGSRIAEHRANETATIHTVSGHVCLRLPDRTVELSAGQLLALGPGLKHDVEATVDSTFVLTLGWHQGQ